MFIPALLSAALLSLPTPPFAFGMDTAEPITRILRVGDIAACLPDAYGENCELVCASEDIARDNYFYCVEDVPDLHWDVWGPDSPENESQFLDDWQRITAQGLGATMETSNSEAVHARLPYASRECQISAQAYAGRGFDVFFVSQALLAAPVIRGEWRAPSSLANVTRCLRMHDLGTWLFHHLPGGVADEDSVRYSRYTLGIEREPLMWFEWAAPSEPAHSLSELFVE